MKAIHNENARVYKLYRLFPIFQRYENESNSQHNHWFGDAWFVVSDISKIQKWKQFTTEPIMSRNLFTLFPIFQRYKNESNSQRERVISISSICCFRYFKDTKMKAIHNLRLLTPKDGKVVSDISKIQKWKQFTTRRFWLLTITSLFPIFQRYKNESNSQPQRRVGFEDVSCFRYFKDTKMKAIHNYT